MTVRELQTSNVKTVSPDTDLAVVAKLMWEGDCGAVRVVTDERQVIGMITDRDICIASATRSGPPSEIRASEVITANGGSCRQPDDDVRIALRAMRKHRVRRLPVVDRAATADRHALDQPSAIYRRRHFLIACPPRNSSETLQAICAHEKHAVA